MCVIIDFIRLNVTVDLACWQNKCNLCGAHIYFIDDEECVSYYVWEMVNCDV